MRRTRMLTVMLMLAVAAMTTSAHIGSPDTWFRGEAGPYPVQVVVRLPGVVPGLGQIDITVEGDGVTKVTAQPVIYNAGPEGAPPADVATPVPGRPGTWHAELWFMTPASFSVKVGVEGARGAGMVAVPVAAVAEKQLAIYPWLGKLMLVLCALLVVGAITIIRAAATDAVVPPGEVARPRLAGTVAPLAGAALVAGLLFGGWQWWQSVAREYADGLYRATPMAARIDTVGGVRHLRLDVPMPTTDGPRSASSRLVPDHGKLMHLFLMQQGVPEGSAAAFGHLHPVPTDSATFSADLGTLPAGRYAVYADVVRETGFAPTMVATVEVPEGRVQMNGSSSTQQRVAGPAADPDDAVFIGTAADTQFDLGDGASVVWERGNAAVTAGDDARLRFVVRTADGTEMPLDPYLGMAGHAVVQRTDGGVYIHLHPNGTVSAGAQRALAERQVTDSVPGMLAARLAGANGMPGMPGMSHSAQPTFAGALDFPYAFPTEGDYRVWVQFKAGGVVRTAAFRVRVGMPAEAAGRPT